MTSNVATINSITYVSTQILKDKSNTLDISGYLIKYVSCGNTDTNNRVNTATKGVS